MTEVLPNLINLVKNLNKHLDMATDELVSLRKEVALSNELLQALEESIVLLKLDINNLKTQLDKINTPQYPLLNEEIKEVKCSE